MRSHHIKGRPFSGADVDTIAAIKGARRDVGYLRANYQWLFDGIGVLVVSLSIAGIIGAIKFAARRRKQRAEANAPKPPPVYTRISALTAAEVSDAIYKAPVLHRTSVHKQFLGTVVQWDVRLRQTYPDDDGLVTLCLSCPQQPLEVICKMRLSDYPELGYANYETPIVVTGKIGTSKYSEINLDDVAFEFPKISPEAPRRSPVAASHKAGIFTSPTYGDVLTDRLLMAAPVLKELKELSRGKRLAVVAIIRDQESENLAKEILEYLKAHKFSLKRPILAYALDPPPQPGVFLVDAGDHMDILVAP